LVGKKWGNSGHLKLDIFLECAKLQ